jgi:4-amino-4-deoxychorismate lyase
VSTSAGPRSGPGAGSGRGAGGGPELVLINGKPSTIREGAGLSAIDRGLHYGDGLFETIACRSGRARFLSLHLERLAAGCERLRIGLSDLDTIRGEIRDALAGTDAALLKLVVTRGEARARGYGWTGSESPTRLLMRYAWPTEDPEAQRSGVRVRVASMRLGENATLAGMKHLNRLEQVLARAEARSEDAAELLLFSSSGRLISGTVTNVFIVQGGCLRTPRIDVCGVAGVMRRVILREARKAGMLTDEGNVSQPELDSATEVFLTNARIGIWPVCSIDDRSLTPGDTTRRLQALIGPMLENPVDA